MPSTETRPPMKPSAYYTHVIALLLIAAAVPLVYFRDSIPFHRFAAALPVGTVDLTPKAEDAFRREIASESGGQIQLVSFTKTDGQASEMMGVKQYALRFDAEIAFAANGYWLAHNPMAGGSLTFTFSPSSVAFGGMNGQTQVGAGSRVRISGTMSGQKSEAGWQFTYEDGQVRN